MSIETLPRALISVPEGFRHAGLAVGAAIVGIVAAAGLFGPALVQDPFAQDLMTRLVPPIWMDGGGPAHVLGTDKLGRDYLSRVIYGARISLLIGLSVMVISGLIGTTLGLVAGYFGGRIDMAVTFIITVRLAMPLILVALAVVAMVGGSLRVVILVLGLLLMGPLRRGHARGDPAGARARLRRGGGMHRRLDPRIIFGEVLPNIMPQLIVVATLEAAQRHPAGSRAVVPRPRRAAAAAVVGPDDRRGQGLHVLLVLADRHSRRWRCSSWCSPSTWWATASATSRRRAEGRR